MEKSPEMMIEDFGTLIANVWRQMRPTTRRLVERALVSAPITNVPSSTNATTGANGSNGSNGAARGGASYDARAEWELSNLLTALDDRAREQGALALSTEQARELGHMAETCALVLHKEARSAEVFGQLLLRALRQHDYVRVDALADTLAARLVPSEICELARHERPAVRAIAQEALLYAPTTVLVNLLGDPVDADVARDALVRQAEELGSEEARWIINTLEGMEAAEDDI